MDFGWDSGKNEYHDNKWVSMVGMAPLFLRWFRAKP